jgi:hypothetical protein
VLLDVKLGDAAVYQTIHPVLREQMSLREMLPGSLYPSLDSPKIEAQTSPSYWQRFWKRPPLGRYGQNERSRVGPTALSGGEAARSFIAASERPPAFNLTPVASFLPRLPA